MVLETSKPVMMGEAGKGGLLDFLVSMGGLGAVADADEEVGLGIVVRERFVGGPGEGKCIALMDMVGRSSSSFFFFFRSSRFVFFVIGLEMRNFEWYSEAILIHICDMMSFLYG